jgi:3'-5' exoribonuclease
MLELQTIRSLKTAAQAAKLEARLHAQVDTIARKETKEGKPFFEVTVADAEGRLVLRAWSDGPAFPFCEGLAPGAFLEISGEFAVSGAYGLDSKKWQCRSLTNEERDSLLGGPAVLREKQTADFELIMGAVSTLGDPRLRALAELFLTDFGERFKRAAAQRKSSRAAGRPRRARSANAAYCPRGLCSLSGSKYGSPHCGCAVPRLWEALGEFLPADGFTMPFDERGELLGHITIGIEVVNALWRKLIAHEQAAAWAELQPPSEDVRLHLLHLLAAHHGELQFGSPVPPKTPEAWVLHYVDNLDAKLEMLSNGYASAKSLAPRIQERVWPLPGNLVAPLPRFVSPPCWRLRCPA